MNPVIAALHTDHINFSKLLTLLAETQEVIENGGQPDYTILLDTVDYLEHYADFYHHPKEDMLYEFQLEQGGEPGAGVAGLIQQHKRLKTQTVQLRAAVEGLLHDAVISRRAFSEQLADFIASQTEHLNAEEREVFPLLERTLMPSHWARVEALLPTRADPLFGHRVAKQYQALLERLTETC